LKAVRDVSFPGAVRGYDRDAVDAYVQRVNGVIAELEISSSPKAAVRHALEQVGEQTSAILQRARDAADEITASARQEAEAVTARAKADAAELVVDASTRADQAQAEAAEHVARAEREAETVLTQARAEAARILAQARKEIAAEQAEAEAGLRRLQADTESVHGQREELLGGVRALAERLEEVASQAAARSAPQPVPEENEEGEGAERRHIEAVPEPDQQTQA
jgi:DivIVA domain-containing protein